MLAFGEAGSCLVAALQPQAMHLDVLTSVGLLTDGPAKRGAGAGAGLTIPLASMGLEKNVLGCAWRMSVCVCVLEMATTFPQTKMAQFQEDV